MAFGIPGSESGGGDNGEFLGRIQYDARVGFWKIVKRVKGPDDRYANQESDPFRAPFSFLMDLGSLEVGYIKIDSPPVFLVVPYGGLLPAQPAETKQDANGKSRKAYLPGFRVKVCSPKTFGDMDAYYFGANSKTVLTPMDELYQRFAASPEASQGKIPVVTVTGTKHIEYGQSKFYAPVFDITGWQDRLPCFGERTVPAPAGKVHPQTHTATGETLQPSAPSNHVPPPAAKEAVAGNMPF